MRRLSFVIAASFLAVFALDASANVTITCPANQSAWVGLESLLTVQATSSASGAVVTIAGSPSVNGMTLEPVLTGNPASVSLRWTPSPLQPSAHMLFYALDNFGDNATCVFDITINAAPMRLLSGVIRDFRESHSDFGVADGDANKRLVQQLLGADQKPVFETIQGPTTITNAASFNQWWNNSLQTSTVRTLGLSNANSIDPNVFTFTSNSFFPIDNLIFGNEGLAHNRYFTYEVHDAITYNAGQAFTFTSSDDLWVFINKRIVQGWAVSGMPGVHAAKSFTVNMDAIATFNGLTAGQTYPIDIFYAHRSPTHPPVLQLQITQQAECNASTAGTTLTSYGSDMTGVALQGTASIAADYDNRLRLVSGFAEHPGAGWLPNPYRLARGFVLTFNAQIQRVSADVDGYAVVLAASPGLGAGLGYSGLPNSLAIEFDSYDDGINDLPAPHLSVHNLGASPNSLNEAATIGGTPLGATPPPNFADGASHSVRIEFTPPATSVQTLGWLRVFIDQSLTPQLEVPIDNTLWAQISNGDRTYIGFTANTPTGQFSVPLISDVNLTAVDISGPLSNLTSPPSSIQAGTTGLVTAQLRDACNVTIKSGGDLSRLAATLTGPQVVATTRTDLLDGRYQVSYTPSSTGWGLYNLGINVSSYAVPASPILNSPFLVHVFAPDLDGDGVYEDVDNCPGLANPSQADFDNDSLGDACDPDDDNDGVADVSDAFPFDGSESVDTDHDGIGNNADPDDDNDGQLDVHEIACGSNPLLASSLSPDFDNDHSPDCVDADDDNDGTPDSLDALPFNPNETVDTDHDGIGNNADPDDDNDGVLDAADAFPLDASESVDTDHDGIGNNADPDDDNDNVADVVDAFPLDASESVDTDHDGIGNNADADDDNDGVLDANDAFPLNAAESVDTDGDGVGNNADTDDDNDGVLDANDAFPLNAAESVDTDGDGIGNNADTDDDNDGVLDGNDAFPLNAAESVDTDGDGIGNNADADDDNDGVLDANDAFPLNAAESVDTDHDGIGNNADTDDDNDNVADAVDAFPLDASESVDTDGDHIGNNADPDDDNDGVLDANDAFPLDASESVDTDHDGVGNNTDADDDNDGVLDANDAFPLNAAESVDTDHDGIGNNADLDDDGDNVADAVDAFPLDASESVDTDHDGIGNNADPDDDNDNVADAVDAFPLNAAESVDTDGDGIGNNADPDDDNDGVLDTADQCPLVAGTGADGCAPTGSVTLEGPQAPFVPGATYNGRRAVPLKWQYASGGAVVNSGAAAPLIRFYGTVACGSTSGGASVPATAAGNSGLQYDTTSRTWQFNWKPSLPNGGYYFTITNQQTGVTSASFAVCLGK